jgi:protein-tyrosine phosphatase
MRSALMAESKTNEPPQTEQAWSSPVSPIEDFNRAELQTCLPDSVAALERMLKQGHSVYVHCSAGVNRSPTVVAAYLHWCLGYELLQAFIHLHACHYCLPDAEAIHGARWEGAPGSR